LQTTAQGVLGFGSATKKKGGEEVSYRKWRVVTLTWLPVVLFSLVVELLQDEEVDDIRHVVVPVAGAQRQMYVRHFNESTSEPSQACNSVFR